MIPEAVAITLQVAQALNELQVPYFVTGSLASAVHGVVRTTAHTDFVAQAKPEHAEQLAGTLKASNLVTGGSSPSKGASSGR